MNSFSKLVRRIAFGILYLISAGILRSQNNPDVPKTPFVAPVPDYFQWTISVDYKSSSLDGVPQKGKAPAVQKLVCTKTGDIKRDVIYFRSGSSVDVWHWKNFLLMKSPNGSIKVEPAGSETGRYFFPEWVVTGFLDTDWISIAAFQGKKRLGTGQEVYAFQGTLKTEGTPVMAMVAADSRLPLVVQKGNEILTYSYQTAPTQMLVLPPDLESHLATVKSRFEYIEAIKKLR